MRKLFLLSSLLVVILFLVSCAPGEKAIAGKAIAPAGGTVLTSKAIIGVNGNGYLNSWSRSGCASNYDCVDDVRSKPNSTVPDLYYDRVFNYLSGTVVPRRVMAESFNFDDLPAAYAGITVHNVTIKYFAKYFSPLQTVFQPFLYLVNARYPSSSITTGKAWEVYSSKTYLSNPYTNLPWKAADLNSLQAGMIPINLDNTRLGGANVSAVWLEVSYSHLCGDALVQGIEQCDDGNTVNTDSCTNICKVPVPSEIVSPPSARPPFFTFIGYLKTSEFGHDFPDYLDEIPGSSLTVPTLGALKELDVTSLESQFIHLLGYIAENDGGQGWFWLEKDGALALGEKDDGLLVVKAKLGVHYFRRLHSGTLNMKVAGALADGVNDDWAPLQKVLDTGFSMFGNSADDIYLVGASKSGNCVYANLGALVVSSGQEIDLKGSTLKLKKNTNRSIIMNRAMFNLHKQYYCSLGTPEIEPKVDIGITITNGTLDGNVDEQLLPKTMQELGASGIVYTPTLYLDGVSNLTLKKVTIKNYLGTGLRLKVDTALVDDLVIDYGRGPGFHLEGKNVHAKGIKILRALDFERADGPADPALGACWFFWCTNPNAMTIDVQDSEFEDIYTKDCDWSVKIQGTSRNLHFGQIISEGGVLKGLKIQGSISDKADPSKDMYITNVTIDKIVSRESGGSGLYLFMTKNLWIKSYEGVNNGLARNQPPCTDPVKCGWRLNQSICTWIDDCADILAVSAQARIDKVYSENSSLSVFDAQVLSHDIAPATMRPMNLIVGQVEAVNPREKVILIKEGVLDIQKIDLKADSGKLDSTILYSTGGGPPNTIHVGSLVSTAVWSGDPLQLIPTLFSVYGVPYGQGGGKWMQVDQVAIGGASPFQLNW